MSNTTVDAGQREFRSAKDLPFSAPSGHDISIFHHNLTRSNSTYFPRPVRFTSPPNGARVLLIEDQGYLSDCTTHLLHSLWPDIVVISVFTAEQAIDAMHNSWYRVLIDLTVPGAQGLSLVRRFARELPPFRCCVISGNDNPQVIEEVRLLGLCGYIQKATSSGVFKEALQRVFSGSSSFPQLQSSSPPLRLTKKQKELVQLLVNALSTKRIAEEMNISEGVVRNNVSNLAALFGVHSRQEIVRTAYEMGFFNETDHNTTTIAPLSLA